MEDKENVTNEATDVGASRTAQTAQPQVPSFGNKLKGWFSQASDVCVDAVTTLSDNLKENYNTAVSRPTHVKCRECLYPYSIRTEAYDWACPKCTLSNPGEKEVCEACQTKQPDPSFQCSNEQCKAFNIIPSTNIAYSLMETQRVTGKWVAQTSKEISDGAKTKIEHLKAAPLSFSCTECGVSINTPPWTCSKCTYSNSSATQSCEMCQVSKAETANQPATVLCSACNATVAVPRSNFTANASSTWFSVKKGAETAADATKYKLYEVTKKPFIVCKGCGYVHSAEGNPTECIRCHGHELELNTTPTETPTPATDN